MTVVCGLLTVLALSARAFVVEPGAELGLRRRSKPSEQALAALSTLSREDLAQLRKLYSRYADLVLKRLDDDWRPGLESGELIEHPEEARLPARQIEEAAAKRQSELDALIGRRAKATARADAEALDDAVSAKRSELKRLQRQLARAKGTCADWSDAVWAELLKVKADDWDLRDGPRTARPWHTAAIACAPAGAETPAVCLAFDPWQNGAADVYDFDSWDEGSLEGKIPAEFFLHHLPEGGGS